MLTRKQNRILAASMLAAVSAAVALNMPWTSRSQSSAIPGALPQKQAVSRAEGMIAAPSLQPSIQPEPRSVSTAGATPDPSSIAHSAGETVVSYRPYKSRRVFEKSAISMCRTFCADEGWIEDQTFWKVGSEEILDMPLRHITKGVTVTKDQREDANSAAEAYNERIRQAATEAFDLLQRYTEDYVLNRIQRVPIGAPLNRRPLAQKPDTRDRYVAQTTCSAGEWVYVIDFRSSDYPDLQQALISLEALREERLGAVKALVGL